MSPGFMPGFFMAYFRDWYNSEMLRLILFEKIEAWDGR